MNDSSCCGGLTTVNHRRGSPAATPERASGIELPPVRIGLLHSLTGTMAVSERGLLDAELLAIEQINARGGVLGHHVEAMVADGASDPDRFAASARELLDGGAKALFGCWTSSSRKAVRPVVEAADNLLWYPVQYEGLEESPCICYTGSCLNQQILPAVEWALTHLGRRIFLLGSDYAFPRTANHFIRLLVDDAGGTVVAEEYTPLGSTMFDDVVERIRTLRPSAVFNTLNGDSNLHFYRRFRSAGLEADAIPIVATSVAETEMKSVAGMAAGHYACWSYFQSVDNPENASFVRSFKERLGEDRVISAPMATAYAQVHLWKRAVERANRFEAPAVRAHLAGCSFPGPMGELRIQANRHCAMPLLIGRLRPDGQFDVVWSKDEPISPLPWCGVETLEAHNRTEQALEALQASEERFRIIAEYTHDWENWIGPSGEVQWMSPGVERVIGYTVEECLAMPDFPLPLFPPGHRENALALFARGVEGATFNDLELVFQHKDGHLVWGLLAAQPIHDAEGRFLGHRSSIRDITERKRHEHEREATLELLRIISECSTVGELAAAAVAFFREVSGCAAVAVRLVEGHDYPFIHAEGFSPDFLDREMSLCARDEAGRIVLGEGGRPVLECTCGLVLSGRAVPSAPCFTRLGSFWMNRAYDPTRLFGPSGDPRVAPRDRCPRAGFQSIALVPLKVGRERIGLLQINDPAPDRINAEGVAHFERLAEHLAGALGRLRVKESLADSEARNRVLFERLRQGVVYHDPTGRVTLANPAARRILGPSIDLITEWAGVAMLGRTFREDDSPFPPEEYPPLMALRTGQAQQAVTLGIAPSGMEERRWFLVDAVPEFRLGKTAPFQVFTTFTEITEHRRAEEERRSLEQQVAHAHKMESLGSLAGGVAHDMNNVLSAILALAEVHKLQAPDGSMLQQGMNTISEACQRGGALVNRMLGFARKKPQDTRVLDLNALVREQVALLERTTLQKVRLVIELEPHLHPVEGDPSALSHALMNLCVNAVDAMQDHGTLVLRTLNLDSDTVALEVRDDGSGMTREVLEKAVDPFFTTKPEGRGTGLGLSIVYGTVRAHNGRLEMESTPDEGTVVRVCLPACKAASTWRGQTGDGPQAARSLRVLVVDDDDLIRASMGPLLVDLGHFPTVVEGGQEAVQLLEDGLEVDAVLLDMNMPVWSGAMTLPAIRGLKPDLPVLLVTGRADQRALDLIGASSNVTLLPKPFSRKELGERLAELQSPPR